ncbi:MAG: NAD(P)-dependent oxidoreductase [Proteobacteria bacterium]|nr:NAD(P)-dependent oxidoreductase [Pseudomonadota bacterium]MBU4258604.1 NAD(P)-dependent oxidoreductase [Pseudomonadota bacterium]MBU4287670.1 NAD(P)-dependent oxidoreductase [Pseudomonadota bacterium]MBU4413553.1 NAD(P)-dependent oxidoreductase [Pseudomonadota bacterium]MCG2759558.1 NAD(P)-dependent oxidoreductase [Desulfobacteraceae bacterium]
MKVFITGSESFIGKELIRQCEKAGIDVVGVDVVENPKPNLYKKDLRDHDLSDFIPEQVDAIVHLAALSRDSDCVNNAYDCFDINVMGTLNLIKAAQKRKAKQFIFASSEWVYDFTSGEEKYEDSVIDLASHTSEYALSKLVSEANLRQQYNHDFCPVTILRFGIIYGPRKHNWSAVESILNAAKTNKSVTVGSVKTSRYFIHVTDIARGILKSIGLEGFHIINLQGSECIPLGDIVSVGDKFLNQSTVIIEKDPQNYNIRKVSNKKAKELIGFESEISFEDGLRTLIDKL